MVLCLREPAVRFLWCCCSSFHFWFSFCFCSSFVVFLHSHFLFDVILHSSVGSHWVFTPILYFQPSPSQSDSRHFIFNHSVIFLPRAVWSIMVLSWHFLPKGIFYLMLLHWHFNLHLSRLPWKPAVLPWILQGFILILRTQSRPICLFDSQ